MDFPTRVLANYKNQAQVERGFRFLKDNSFRVSEIFLKKNTRIEALTMIMTLSPLIYSLTEFRVRKALKERNETVPNPEKTNTKANPQEALLSLSGGRCPSTLLGG